MSLGPPDIDVSITFASSESIDALEPLWLSLFDHHATVGPGPFIDRRQSWPARRRLYRQVLSDPDAFVVLAHRAEKLVGYALVALHEGPDDTWPTGDRMAEVETLVVAKSERGQRIGSLLLDSVDARLEELNISSLFIGVMAGNDDAMRFYGSRGLQPSIIKLMRLGPPPAQSAADPDVRPND
ncbi:MAG TPA: GNAT family N-acetyltransferase [Actinomycetes bacterium]|nr:GNAT family N-acetyltransferase [Actinomycetes bacterium]